MPRGAKRPVFKLRARLVGALQWNCPFCGYVNRSAMDLPRFRVRCATRSCRRRFMLGFRFFEMPGGGPVGIPPDWLIEWDEAPDADRAGALAEPLPEATLEREPYRKGNSVNQLVALESRYE